MSFTPDTDVALTSHSTLRLQSRADYFARVTSRKALAAAIEWARRKKVAITVLGEGSNVVLRARVPGLVLQPALTGIEVEDDRGRWVTVAVAAGENWHRFVIWCLGRGLRGMENLALIPGSVGAAPIQNIGAYGVEVATVILDVETMDTVTGAARQWRKEDCRFGYRDSVFKQAAGAGQIVTGVRFCFDREAVPVLHYPGLVEALADADPSPTAIFDAVVALRRRKLPDWMTEPNAGSFFKNPVVPSGVAEALTWAHPDLPTYPGAEGTKLSAAWLIEQCGWRGRALGPAAVSAQHALVLTNTGGATGADILLLAQAIESDVQARFGVALEIEPRIVGSD